MPPTMAQAVRITPHLLVLVLARGIDPTLEAVSVFLSDLVIVHFMATVLITPTTTLSFMIRFSTGRIVMGSDMDMVTDTAMVVTGIAASVLERLLLTEMNRTEDTAAVAAAVMGE